MERAKEEPWLLSEDNHRVESWLELLPFSDRSVALHEALALVDARFRQPWLLQRVLTALGNSPSEKAEELLAELAEHDPRLYQEHYWLSAVVSRNTESSARMLVDLVCTGKLVGGTIEGYRLSRDLAGLIQRHPQVRAELFHRYEALPPGADRWVVVVAIAELSSPDCLEALIRGYARSNRPFDGTLQRLVEGIALGREPSTEWAGAYELHSADAAILRKQLLAMLEDGGAVASLAEASLTAIDELRDEHGRVDSEPRHPDITSNRVSGGDAMSRATKAANDERWIPLPEVNPLPPDCFSDEVLIASIKRNHPNLSDAEIEEHLRLFGW